MNDIQKKLDELTQLREQLVHLTNNFELANIKNISGTSVYHGKVQVIAQQYQTRQLETKTFFNNVTNTVRSKIKESQKLAKERQRAVKESQKLAKESRRLAKESQKLAKESRRLAKESQRLAKESGQSVKESHELTLTNDKSFKNKNNTNVDNSINSIKNLISIIEKDIDLATIELKDSIEMNKINSLCESSEFIQEFLKTHLFTGNILFDNTTVNIVLSKIKNHCDWHYPGLQVNPQSKEWINCMVAADPLYLIDHESLPNGNNNTIAGAIADYPIEYQRRLRVYTKGDQSFPNLPQKQFGIIACCDFLNLFNIDFINNYLFTFLNLLRPGGNLVCTIQLKHPCTVNTLVEPRYFNYASDLVVQKLFTNVGFEITSIQDLISDTIDWDCILLITAKKPGELTTSKAHQVLGSIINK